MTSHGSGKMWGGRFSKATDPCVAKFTESLSFDRRLFRVDTQLGRAHARALERAQVISSDEAATLVEALLRLEDAFCKGDIQLGEGAEDVHSEIERLLVERVGDLAKKLHTGRSRNDEVATATRLHLRQSIDHLQDGIRGIQKWLLRESRSHFETILPGVTHLQHAQPVTLGHHLLAYFWMLSRDAERFSEVRRRTNEMPLGSGALAGSSFPLDRDAVAKELGFEKASENSLDAVSDRDFVVEFLSAASLLMLHLSRWAEEWVIWSTPEYAFIEMSDSVTTGSSMMPQKKNPDVAELVRGRVGRVMGARLGAEILLKGLPLSYQRDLQEDKVHLFSGLDAVHETVEVMQVLIENVRFKTERMREATRGDFSTATDLAEDLVRNGVAFREAHHTVGEIVRYCIDKKVVLEDLSDDEFRKFSVRFSLDIRERILPENSVKARTLRGGTAPKAVEEQWKRAEERYDAFVG